MQKILATALLGAASILVLAGLARVDAPAPAAAQPFALPQVAAEAPLANAPRECSNARNVTTGCTYQ
jgi:hypothetical protein